jgi:hypothetical protein
LSATSPRPCSRYATTGSVEASSDRVGMAGCVLADGTIDDLGLCRVGQGREVADAVLGALVDLDGRLGTHRRASLSGCPHTLNSRLFGSVMARGPAAPSLRTQPPRESASFNSGLVSTSESSGLAGCVRSRR